ncbi:MAG: DMT family transporter [Gemmatimonadaceae bacterium]|nr:DMT family transporter [Chitinophagaceae bacterium]
MKILFFLLPFFAGVAISIQAGINSQLRVSINHPVLAAFISFFVGTITLAIMLFFSKQVMPEISQYANIGWHKYIGGLLGVFVVIVALVSVREIGASNLAVLVIAGQLVTAVIMDQFGLLGLARSPITMQRAAGVCLLIAGVYLVNKK